MPLLIATVTTKVSKITNINIPFAFLLIAVAYPWLKPIIEPITNTIINRRKRVVRQ